MVEDKTTLTECYVGFLDLMGVRNLVKVAEIDAELRYNLIAALQETKNVSSFSGERRFVETGVTKKWSLQVQAFSDCVVLFIPTESKMLSWLFASICRLHDRLIRLNVPIRGGITIGGMHWDEDWNKESFAASSSSEKATLDLSTPVAFGSGLIGAFDLEKNTAVYPRILISDDLYEHIDEQEKNLKRKVFPLANSGRLIEFIRQDDFDGLWHLDVLHKNIIRYVIRRKSYTDDVGKQVIQNIYDDTNYDQWLEIVKQFIEKRLDDVSGEKLRSKYMWLASYYNDKAKDHGCKLIRCFEKLVSKRAINLTVKKKSNEKYERARKSLPSDLRVVFDNFVEDYQLACTKHHGAPFESYNIPAEMVRVGWRSVTKPHKDDEGQANGGK